MLKTLGNILWHFPFLGFLNAIAVYLVGLLLTATVIASPIGLGLMEFGKFLFAPFGRAMVSKSELATEQSKAWKAYSTVLMILYLPFGLILSIAAIVQVGLLFITIVGIPVALVIAKSLGTYWNPVNKKCVHLAVAEELERRKGEAAIHRHLSATGAGQAMDATPEVVVPQPTAETSSFPPAVQSAARELKGVASKMVGQLAALRVPTGSAAESCASCGASVSSNAAFCGKCGAPVQRPKCPQCSEVNAPTARFCGKCGGELGRMETSSTRPESRQDRGQSAAATPTPATTATVESASKPQEFVRDENVCALPLRQPSPFMPSERVEQPAPSDVERVASPAGPIVRPVSDESRSAEPAHTSSGDVASRRWLAIGGLAVLAAAGGGYWYYKSRGASPTAAETAQVPDSQTPEISAAPEPEGDVLEVPPAQTQSETPQPVQSQVADAPQVSVGDRWVTEVVDHQDAKLNYRAERTVTGVGNDRIVTSVRTVGKDYVRSVEYSGQWALIATHLPSGATTTYSPALPYLSFPLQPGKSWEARVVETDAEGKTRVHEIRAKMESWETVQVPAGTFNALKVVLTDDISKDGVVVQQGQDISWYAPDVRRTVKTEESSFDPATGERRRRTVSLVDYSLQNSGDAIASATGAAAEASCKDHRGADVHKHSGSEAKHVVMLSERCGDYSVSRDGKVVYAGETLGTLDASIVVNPNVALLLSTPSPVKGLQYALLWDGDSGGGYSAHVIDPSAKRIVVRNVVTGKIRVGSVIRWSPAENYAVVPVIGEVQTEIVAIDLAKGHAANLSIGKLERDGCDAQSIDFTQGRWVAEAQYRFVVQLSQSPWAEQPCPAGRQYPAIPVTVDLAMMSVARSR